ncbi:cobalt ECF transporter T component CbiQ [Neobacillus sp. DY30]|uniref:cobalt ECF transporter T component CbiQ n=1 Tax=Neobacillus sp. DY30 TaxID=3047871 RepID=UPI0024C07290|nr:cobalt ECF transporter T component CbiQ [Neobacillus sp. DY30]WHY03347.1 cobalt ECF transporter T component CbiQ [Neobacillus sp. DY30]
MIKIDDYAYSSGLKDVHPVEKVSFALIFLFFTILSKNISVACFTFTVMSIVVIFRAKIPFIVYLKLLFVPFVFLMTSIVAIIFSIAPIYQEDLDVLWKAEIGLWQIYISSPGIQQSYKLATTILASVSCLYFLVLSTPLNQMMWVLKKVKLPTVFIELMGITYRFIFVLLEKMNEIYIAQTSRLGYQNYKSGFSSVAQLIVSLFVKSMRSAKELQIAIDSRGGDEHLYDVDLSLSYNRGHFVFIFISLVTLFMINVMTKS